MISKSKITFVGSVSLEAIFVAMGSVLLVSSVINLGRYAVTLNAVRHTARTVSRCLTPTDPKCTSYALTPIASNMDWYGIPKTTPPPTSKFFVDRYKYSASMPTDYFTVDFDKYLIHEATPVLSLSAKTLYHRSYQGVMNQWENRFGRFSRSFTTSTPATVVRIDGFPSFQDSYEVGNRNSSPTDYFGSNNPNRSVDFTRLATPFFPKDSSGETLVFVSDWVKVPLPSGVISAEELTKLRCANRNCSVAENVSSDPITDSRLHPWNQYAHIAFRMFARSLENNNDLYWDEIYIDTLHRNNIPEDQLFPGSAAQGAVWNDSRSLGGRSQDTVDAGDWYGLHLRGPRSAHGGSAGDTSAAHENIWVERGGHFRVRAVIHASKGFEVHGTRRQRIYEPSVEVISYYHFDQLRVVSGGSQTTSYSCSPELRIFSDGLPERCPTAAECEAPLSASATFGESRNSCSLDPASLRIVPVCNNDGNSVQVTEAVTAQTINTDSCFPIDSRPAAELFSPDKSRIVCSVREDSDRSVNQTVPASYPCSGPITTDSQSCINSVLYPVSDEAAVMTSCIAHLKKTSTGQFSNPNVESEADIAISSYQNHLSYEAWDRIDRFGNQIPLSQSQGIETISKHFENVGPILGRTSGDPSPWELKVGDIPNGTVPHHFRLLHTRREWETFSEIYPFRHNSGLGEREIPYWGGTNIADYNGDCILEPVCTAEFKKFSSLEEALRHYASAKYPEALDKSYTFNFSPPTFILSEEVSSISDLPGCTPLSPSCNSGQIVGIDQYLGKFSTITSPNGPPQCSGESSEFSHCYAKSADPTPPPISATTTTNLDYLTRLAQHELSKLLPESTLGCNSSTAGCAELTVDLSSDSRSPKVGVKYGMPLTPPFSTLLGRDTLTISATKANLKE